MKCFTEEKKRSRERETERERETRIVPRYAITMKYYSTRIFANIRGSYGETRALSQNTRI
jgi:hypothetical protein